MNTLTLSAENLIEISLLVWPGKFESVCVCGGGGVIIQAGAFIRQFILHCASFTGRKLNAEQMCICIQIRTHFGCETLRNVPKPIQTEPLVHLKYINCISFVA